MDFEIFSVYFGEGFQFGQDVFWYRQNSTSDFIDKS